MKRVLQQKLKSGFRLYRFAYTIFSFVALVSILYFQFTMHSFLLFRSPAWLQIVGVLVMILGALIMSMMIWKYFMKLSGVRWLYRDVVNATLEVDGLHKFVRHPLYSGTFAFIWGWFLVSPFASYLIACIIITSYTLIALSFEEEKLVLEFGDDYIQYKKNVPKLIPNLKKENSA